MGVGRRPAQHSVPVERECGAILIAKRNAGLGSRRRVLQPDIRGYSPDATECGRGLRLAAGAHAVAISFAVSAIKKGVSRCRRFGDRHPILEAAVIAAVTFELIVMNDTA